MFISLCSIYLSSPLQVDQFHWRRAVFWQHNVPQQYLKTSEVSVRKQDGSAPVDWSFSCRLSFEARSLDFAPNSFLFFSFFYFCLFECICIPFSLQAVGHGGKSANSQRHRHAASGFLPKSRQRGILSGVCDLELEHTVPLCVQTPVE